MSSHFCWNGSFKSQKLICHFTTLIHTRNLNDQSNSQSNSGEYSVNSPCRARQMTIRQVDLVMPQWLLQGSVDVVTFRMFRCHGAYVAESTNIHRRSLKWRISQGLFATRPNCCWLLNICLFRSHCFDPTRCCICWPPCSWPTLPIPARS